MNPVDDVAPTSSRFSWRSVVASAPGAGLALLPKAVCPACWPAYAGFLSALGLGFLMETRYLLPLTALFLVIALSFLAFRAPGRRGYGPFVAGVAASGLLMIGKFVFDSGVAMYAGVAGLMAASLWNSWPRKVPASGCASCSAPGSTATGRDNLEVPGS